VGVLLLVRHGQASFGADDYDVLSALGAEQGRRAGARLAAGADGVRRVVSGGLRRQQDTARALVEAAGIAVPVETDPRWDEYDADDVVTGLPPRTTPDNASFQLLLDDALLRWTGGEHDADYRESWPAFAARVRAGLEDALAGPGTTIVVTSAGPIGVCSADLLALPSPGWTRIARVQVNAALTKVVSGRSGTSLVSVNDHAHLEEPGLTTYR
jgi:broad specificity phosphatase PhoE